MLKRGSLTKVMSQVGIGKESGTIRSDCRHLHLQRPQRHRPDLEAGSPGPPVFQNREEQPRLPAREDPVQLAVPVSYSNFERVHLHVSPPRGGFPHAEACGLEQTRDSDVVDQRSHDVGLVDRRCKVSKMENPEIVFHHAMDLLEKYAQVGFGNGSSA